MFQPKSTLALLLPLLCAVGERAAAQCLTGSCPTDTTINTSAPFEDQLLGPVPFRQMSLAVDQFDPDFYAKLHDVPPAGISLLGVNAEFHGEISPLVQLDSGGTPQSCQASWHTDVESVVFSNPDIGNPGLLVIVCEEGTTTLPAGNGGPPPWDVTLIPPPSVESFCFADTTNLAAWIGTGQVEFATDGLAFSSAEGCTDLHASFANQGLLRVTVTYTYCVDGDPRPVEPGTAYCFCDGSGAAPPCGNPGGADEGCANSTGSGATLSATGTNSVSADDLAFQGATLLPGQPALLFAGLNAINGGDGAVFGDGLRCAGGGVTRLGIDVPDAGGQATWGPALAGTGGWTAGDTRRFQAWYRNPTGSPCSENFNLSHGYEIVFEF